MTTERRARPVLRRARSPLLRRQRCLLRWLAVGALLLGSAGAFARDSLSIVYLERHGDPFYAPHRAYTGLTLRDRHRPFDGAKTAIREGRVLGRVVGTRFELVRHTLGADDDVAATVEGLHRDGGAGIFVLDVPRADLDALGPLLRRDDLLFFNVRHPDDDLRGAHCAPALFHTLPSHAMVHDALVQFLAKKNWRSVLVLLGEQPADRETADAFARSARKFGLRIAGERTFVPGTDPRRRDQNNVSLLTSETDHDVVFLADAVGEFGRYVPYSVHHPRPVVGGEGLQPGAWHWTWERHGAPQLNQRFDRVAGRRMQAMDYAAWAAVRAVIDAVVRTRATDVGAIRGHLTSDAFTFDNYKGAPGSFRPWDRQLRQPVLLHTANAVIGRAPLDGFLHPKNTLDTLGRDRRESDCGR